MLSGTLSAHLLGSFLAGKATIRVGEVRIRAEHDF